MLSCASSCQRTVCAFHIVPHCFRLRLYLYLYLSRSSGPQGSIEPLTIIDDPADWTAESLKGKESTYTYTLTKVDVNEIITAVQKIKARIPHTEEGVKSVRLRNSVTAGLSAACAISNLSASSRCTPPASSGDPFPRNVAAVHLRQLRFLALLQLTKEDYDLPTLGGKLVDLAKNVSLGRGFQLITCASQQRHQHQRMPGHLFQLFEYFI